MDAVVGFSFKAKASPLTCLISQVCPLQKLSCSTLHTCFTFSSSITHNGGKYVYYHHAIMFSLSGFRKAALTLIPAVFPHRILLSTTGCLDILVTKSFLLTQVRLSQSACTYKWRGTGNALVTTSRGQVSYRCWCLTNMCYVSKASPWVSFFCWISTRSCRKQGTIVRWAHHSPFNLHFHIYSAFVASGWTFGCSHRVFACMRIVSDGKFMCSSCIFIFYFFRCLQVTRSLLIQGSLLSSRLPYDLASLWPHLVFTWGTSPCFRWQRRIQAHHV